LFGNSRLLCRINNHLRNFWLLGLFGYRLRLGNRGGGGRPLEVGLYFFATSKRKGQQGNE
jgi:hypothetical protein